MQSFVLIDYENVQPNNLEVLLGDPSVRIKVFLGTSQSKIPVEMALAIQRFGAAAEYVRIDGSGRNALDFHIAYYLGRLALEAPGARFHIVSRDQGFEPLCRHLNAQGVTCKRVATLAEVRASLGRGRAVPPAAPAPARTPGAARTPAAAPITPTATATLVDAAIERIGRWQASKPRTRKSLGRRLRQEMGNTTEAAIEGVLVVLAERGVIAVDRERVQYAGDARPALVPIAAGPPAVAAPPEPAPAEPPTAAPKKRSRRRGKAQPKATGGAGHDAAS